MRIGIFGGSFDPIHYGHLILAETCREAMQLDRVFLVPSATSPLKRGGASATDQQRVDMVQLATSGSQLSVSTVEIDRQGVSYTIDTVKEFAASNEGSELFFLMGADLTNQLDQWRSPDEIFAIAKPVIVKRPGSELDIAAVAKYQNVPIDEVATVEIPQLDLSSTEMRERVASGRSIRFRTPRAVEQYILNDKIYQQNSPTE